MSTAPRRGPVILDLNATPLPPAPSPAEAPPPDPIPSAAGTLLGAAAAPGRGGSLGAMAGAALVGLVGLWLGLGLQTWVAGLLSTHPALGWVAGGLLAVVALALAVFVLRELAALGRLGRTGALRASAETAAATGDVRAARAVAGALIRLYDGRPGRGDLAARLGAAQAETPDAAGLLMLVERAALGPADAAAERAVARAARDVAAATALIPLALVDVLAVLAINLRMIRTVAEAYGGRAGWLGSWRLLRAVARHLAATGLIAATDDLVGPLVGGGVLARLSRRFGEAAVNAALTARVGVAAIEVCRPMPFVAHPAPRAGGIVGGALAGWWSAGPAPTA